MMTKNGKYEGWSLGKLIKERDRLKKNLPDPELDVSVLLNNLFSEITEINDKQKAQRKIDCFAKTLNITAKAKENIMVLNRLIEEKKSLG